MKLKRIQGMVPEALHQCFYQKLREIQFKHKPELTMQDFLADVMSKGLIAVAMENDLVPAEPVQSPQSA